MGRPRRSALTLVVIVCAAALLSACEEEEQGRILRYDKGSYLGKPDQSLSEKQLKELEGRVREQSYN